MVNDENDDEPITYCEARRFGSSKEFSSRDARVRPNLRGNKNPYAGKKKIMVLVVMLLRVTHGFCLSTTAGRHPLLMEISFTKVILVEGSWC
ncbi:hypothetical protein LR48_Vigan09g176500 [Vigna angularis]|uniref:Uncharacterized protein n=1 Tax=Phaseolus angularis TaxID=3914 RepID=A0A0L9VDG5_PHAAN|nr:hypothetical protein LR48_Vigan09g176500 [Vigna angularis]